MADLDDLVSALSGQRQVIAARNPFLTASKSFQGLQLQPRGDESFKDLLLASLIQGLGGGVLQGIGIGQAQDEIRELERDFATGLLQPERRSELFESNPDLAAIQGSFSLADALQEREDQILKARSPQFQFLNIGPGRIARVNRLTGQLEEIPLSTPSLGGATVNTGINTEIGQSLFGQLAEGKRISELSSSDLLSIPEEERNSLISFAGKLRDEQADILRTTGETPKAISENIKKLAISAPAVESQLGRLVGLIKSFESDPAFATQKLTFQQFKRLLPLSDQRLLNQELAFNAFRVATEAQGRNTSDKDLQIITNFLAGGEAQALGVLSERVETFITDAVSKAGSALSIEGQQAGRFGSAQKTAADVLRQLQTPKFKSLFTSKFSDDFKLAPVTGGETPKIIIEEGLLEDPESREQLGRAIRSQIAEFTQRKDRASIEAIVDQLKAQGLDEQQIRTLIGVRGG